MAEFPLEFSDAEDVPRGHALMREAFAVLDRAQAIYSPRAHFALFSGGHDSLTATSVAFEWAAAKGKDMTAAHIRTGTGIPATLEFVERTCEAQGWPLKVYEAPVPYEQIVVEYGFPGPGQHGLMYARLKERALRQLVREAKQEWNDRIMLVSGVRSEESTRRMRHVEEVQREGAQLWAADIWNWAKLDCGRYIAERGLERNPVVDKLHMSGECLCGAFARPGEIKELELWFPEHAAWLHELEEKVRAAGVHGCVWGTRPPRVHREQMALAFGQGWDDEPTGILCVGCGSDEDAEAA